jgi:hypothetical protein
MAIRRDVVFGSLPAMRSICAPDHLYATRRIPPSRPRAALRGDGAEEGHHGPYQEPAGAAMLCGTAVTTSVVDADRHAEEGPGTLVQQDHASKTPETVGP